jgi:nucleoside-diphosphate-sugar epimerase
LHPESRGDAYTYAKVKQDEIVASYGREFGLPYVVVRPGFVYGPASKGAITNRIGVDTFGFFMHMGGSTQIPLSYVDNCAEAIVLAGLMPGVEGEVFNAVDSNLPSSRKFLRLYKKNVRRFRSVYIPKAASYLLCYFWEWYVGWSEGQVPPAYNRKGWHTFWKKTEYTNQKLKTRLGWSQPVPTEEALRRYFEAARLGGANA